MNRYQAVAVFFLVLSFGLINLPAAYADASVQVLRAYGDSANWAKLWVASHIFYHETKQYGRRGFRLSPRP